jgi:hypothetical protein
MTACPEAETRAAHMPWYRTAASLGVGERYCTCCERDLSGHAVRMLELDQRTYTYHDLGGVPADKSQGWFPFGLKCARNKLREHRAAIALAEGGAPC